jgi:hypothetical protein
MTRRDVRPAIVRVLAAVLGAAGLSGCSGEVTPQVTAGVDACANCNMVIQEVNQAAGWIEDGEFVPFDSPGCLLARFETLRHSGEAPPEDLYFADLESGFFHPARAVTFLLTSHRHTVMNSGALVFGSRAAAERAREREDEMITDWTGYRTLRGTPDRQVEVILGPDGLTPDRIEVDKGELVLWTVESALDEGERSIAVKGYPDLDPVRVVAGEGPVSFRLLATRPGSGFPVVESGTEEVLGVMVVRGPHTADEQAGQ